MNRLPAGFPPLSLSTHMNPCGELEPKYKGRLAHVLGRVQGFGPGRVRGEGEGGGSEACSQGVEEAV